MRTCAECSVPGDCIMIDGALCRRRHVPRYLRINENWTVMVMMVTELWWKGLRMFAAN